MFWKVILGLYLAATAFSAYVLYSLPVVSAIDGGNFIFSAFGIIPLAGLAFERRIWKKGIWVGYFLANALLMAFMVVTVWLPLIPQQTEQLLTPANLIGMAILFTVLYGHYSYAFRRETLWA